MNSLPTSGQIPLFCMKTGRFSPVMSPKLEMSKKTTISRSDALTSLPLCAYSSEGRILLSIRISRRRYNKNQQFPPVAVNGEIFELGLGFKGFGGVEVQFGAAADGAEYVDGYEYVGVGVFGRYDFDAAREKTV